MLLSSPAVLTINKTPEISRRIDWITSAPFLMVHLACFLAIWTGIDLTAAILFGVCFFIRKFGITTGYHRYFAHKSFKTGRLMQFVLAWLGCSATQKGPLWWASHHRRHHRFSDMPGDVHSPTQDGFWWSHVGWIVSRQYHHTELGIISDLVKYPELRWLNKYHVIPPITLAVLTFAIGGWSGLVWGYFISTTVLYHTTFFINSLCHLFGRRRFPTKDTSRNSFLLALLTMGEGWHNNHHYYPSSANQGFYWWEIDLSYYALKALSWLGLVWDLRRPPERVLDLGRSQDATREDGIEWRPRPASLL